MIRTVLAGLALAAAPAQERPVPTFATQAAVILVDVVVLDDEGRPVRGLAREEFTVLEDGRPQAIVGFEPRDLRMPGGAGAPAPSAGPVATGTSSGPGGRGRAIALVVDDLGIEPLRLTALKDAVARWLESKADPRDEVVLVTSSGDLWWSDTVATGKTDLLAVLARAQSHKSAQGSTDYMSDWEAYRIDNYEDVTGAREASAGPAGQTAGPPTGPTPSGGFGPANVTGRVAARWQERRACLSNCRTLVQQRARELQDRRIRRTRAVFGAVERLSKAMAGARGRKTIVVFSDGLIRDSQLDADDRAADAAQLGNTAVSFVDTRGLGGSGTFSLDQASAPMPGDVGLIHSEQTVLAAAGTAYIAEETGGSVVSGTNDLADGLGRLVDESSAYYLLGYEPPKTPDGKWHKLEVKVARPGLTVRARRRYFAASGSDRKGAPSARPEKGSKVKRDDQVEKLPARAFDPAILTGGDDALPVRLAPYVMEPAAGGKARVLVALEIDLSALARGGPGRAGPLDLTLMALSRDQPGNDMLDQRLDLELDAKTSAGWFTLSRELKMPPGVAQVRLLVRDVGTGMTGRAAGRFEVPSASAPYLSTPVLTDKIDKPKEGDTRLVPVAHREFRPAGALFCQYEVHGIPRGKDDPPVQVSGGYRLASTGGQVVAEAPPTPIAPARDGRFVRILGFPLDGLPEGEYELSLQVTESGTGRTLGARESFRLSAPSR